MFATTVLAGADDDGCLYRAKGVRDATFQRLWAELDRNEDILDERLVRVAARLKIVNRFRFLCSK